MTTDTIESTVIIRRGEHKDYEQALVLLEEFHAEALSAFGIEFDEDRARYTINEVRENSFILEIDGEMQGLIAGKIVEYPLQNDKIFQEMIWYVRKEFRGKHGLKLLHHLETWCKENNMNILIMAHMSNLKSAKIERYYNRIGYQLMESLYVKRLK